MASDRLERRYLEHLDATLGATSISDQERREILLEIESHLAEARRAGASTADLMRELGPPDELARAYAAELLLRPIEVRPGPLNLAIRVMTVLASTVMVVLVGGAAILFLLSGLLGVVLGVAGPFLPPAWVDPTLRAGAPQVVVIVTSLILAAVGAVLFRILIFNLRLLTAAIRRPLPARR